MKYIIKTELSPVGGGNPEFAPDPDMVKGIEADGYLLLTLKDGDPACACIQGVTTVELARMLAGDDSEAGSTVRQAMAIAEGLIRAKEILKTERKSNLARELAEMMRGK